MILFKFMIVVNLQTAKHYNYDQSRCGGAWLFATRSNSEGIIMNRARNQAFLSAF